VSQLALALAVQAQPAAVLTVTLPVPPLMPKMSIPGVMEKLQPAACVTKKLWPAIVIDPKRCVGSRLGATV